MDDTDFKFEILCCLLGSDVKPLDRSCRTTCETSCDDFLTACICGCEHESVSHLSRMATSEGNQVKREFFVDMGNFFDPKYDFDYTNLSESKEDARRGGESYKRPIGFYRMALKVKDKYRDGNSWLGVAGWRDHSSPGEWPVSFHGTSKDGAKGIFENEYKPGSGQTYGRGIYSTPNVDTAEQYTKVFTSKNGKKYKVIMQNRLNPCEREQTAVHDYWLIPVPHGTPPQQEKEIVRRAIRPYGILIQEV